MPSWFDVTTAEPAAAIGFHMQLFEWTAAPAPDTECGKYIARSNSERR
ncbi:hypothetical protein [Nocardia brasiliensis]|nr:hypothetical protein [Nocardia brasiliensis]